ncbi:MAG: hypothetical protein WCF90_03505 [Methanomicrobiales archaeon]
MPIRSRYDPGEIIRLSDAAIVSANESFDLIATTPDKELTADIILLRFDQTMGDFSDSPPAPVDDESCLSGCGGLGRRLGLRREDRYLHGSCLHLSRTLYRASWGGGSIPETRMSHGYAI